MDCIVLGNGGMMPMPSRFTTSVLLRHEGRNLMFDAGEGIQIALKKGGIGIRSLEVVAISHLHADHVLGLPGILMFRAQCDDPGPLTIVGPPGIQRFVRHTIEDLRYRLNFSIDFIEWSPRAGSEALRWNGGTLLWEPLEHSTLCLGYRFQEDVRPGRFHPDQARALGIPPGPLFGRLQRGESVTLADGRTIHPSDVLGPARRGRSVVFATDTVPCPGLHTLCEDADLAFVEGMFTEAHHKEAAQKKHATAAGSAALAARARTKRLVLLHISPRYTIDDERQLKSEARAHFPGAKIGRGLAQYDVPLPD